MITSVAYFTILFMGTAIGQFQFQPMKPMQGFQMQQMNFGQNNMFASQSQGQGAATGEGSADFGELSSLQNTNTNTTNQGTVQTGNSLGQCVGGNCRLNGASQVQIQGQFQSQSQGQGSKMKGGAFQNPAFGGFGGQGLFGNNFQSQTQTQSQFGGGGAAIGTGAVDNGTVQSAQTNNAVVNKDGAKVDSANIGQGAGTNVALTGAVQASGQGQVASQTAGRGSVAKQHHVKGANGTKAVESQSNVTLQAAEQSQSKGDAAATGQASAAEGTAQSAQNAVVNTNAAGTSANSNSVNTAAGKGIRVGGAVSSSGGTQGQSSQQIDFTALRKTMFAPMQMQGR